MNTLDIILAVVVAAFLVRGLFRGLVMELASIAGLALGFYAANQYRAAAEPFIAQFLDNPLYASIAAYAVVFVAALVAVGLVTAVLRRVLQLAMLSWADHLFGGLFGFIKGVLLCSIALMAITMYLPDLGFYRVSNLKHMFAPACDHLARFLPTDLRDRYDRHAHALRGHAEKKAEHKAEPSAPPKAEPKPAN